ncbi:MAG: FMN-binding glutamate synthase family protein [Kiritimatiellia bacterium]
MPDQPPSVSAGSATAELDLFQLAKLTNRLLPAALAISLWAGLSFSFYYHFLTVPLLILNLLNFSYRHVQTRHTLLKNFGIVAQLRYFLESVGPEMRQYLYTGDTEERPFNRLERAEVYRKAKGIDSTSAFGSQQEFDQSEIKLRHAMYPTPDVDLSLCNVVVGASRNLDTAVSMNFPLIISAMSYGALSGKAVEALSRGAKAAGILMNTGEGGYPKYHLKGGADLIFQMGTGKFGVRHENGTLDEDALRDLAAHPNVKMIEIKLSQGAKPGKGGILPGEKVSREIAELRKVPMGEDVISPPGHAECHDAATTVEFIRRVQDVSGLPVGIKLCLGNPEDFSELVGAMVAQNSHPDFITIDGAEGGTGAAPAAFMDSMGLPLFVALRHVQSILVKSGIRDRLHVFASGKLIHSARQIQALCLGADACCTARGFMFSLGCIQALQCNKNTCPVGIATQNPELQRGFDIEDKARRVENYVNGIRHDFKQLVAATGVHCVSELNERHLYIPPGHPVNVEFKGDAA